MEQRHRRVRLCVSMILWSKDTAELDSMCQYDTKELRHRRVRLRVSMIPLSKDTAELDSVCQ